MSLLNEIVAAALAGVQIPFKVTHWDGSENGHPHSVSIQDASLAVDGVHLNAGLDFTVSGAFDTAGPHALAATLALPHGPSTIILDGAVVPNGKMVVAPVLKGKRARVELLFFCPTASDPLFHYRADGDLAKL